MSAIGSIMIMAPMIAGAIGAVAPVILIVIGVITLLIQIGIVLYKHWDDIKAKAAELRDAVVQAWQDLKDRVSEIVQAFKDAFIGIYDGIKTRVLSIISAMVSGIISRFQNLKANATSIWNAVRNAITNPMEAAKAAVAKIIAKLKSLFPIKVGNLLSHIKLPHFSINGKFSLNPPSVPSFGIRWYKTGGIFDSPSVIGVGEAGTEAVVPIDRLWEKLDSMTAALEQSARERASLTEILMQYLPYLPEVANMNLVTDTGALVGQLAPRMDAELGVLANRQRRQ